MLKPGVRKLTRIIVFSSYRAVNTLYLEYKNQQGNDRCLHKIRTFFVRNVEYMNVKTWGT